MWAKEKKDEHEHQLIVMIFFYSAALQLLIPVGRFIVLSQLQPLILPNGHSVHHRPRGLCRKL